MKETSGNGAPPARPAALVLPGGGARAAYQVGVLKAIAGMVPHDSPIPFRIISGTSAGAINAAVLAAHAHNFRDGVAALDSVWSHLRGRDIYRTGALHVLGSGLHWLLAVLLGGLGRNNPASLLDNRPLRALLHRTVPLHRVADQLEAGHLDALGVTASSYSSARSVTFFQARDPVPAWSRSRRRGRPATIGVEHLMASCAVPVIFPPVRVGEEFFGDGALRQTAPLSPAIHLGAGRVLVIGVRDERPGEGPDLLDRRAPSLGAVAGYMLDTIFMDGLYGDMERLTRINQLLEFTGQGRWPEGLRPLRRVAAQLVLPTEDVREVAGRHIDEMALPVRLLLRGLGAKGRQGLQLNSFIMFERGYTRALIRLGYDDAMARRHHLADFLRNVDVPLLDAPESVAHDLSG